MTKQRFLVTAQYYVLAENQKDANALAEAIAKNEILQHDNQYSLVSVVPSPFGRIPEQENKFSKL